MKLTDIGKLRHRVTFQYLTRTNDGQGGFSSAWNNLASLPTVWAEVTPSNTKERFFSETLQYQRSHKVVIRYRDDLTTEMRMIFDERIFQIKSIKRLDERRFFLVLDLEENQGT